MLTMVWFLIVWAIVAQAISACEPALSGSQLPSQEQRQVSAVTIIVGGVAVAAGRYPFYVQLDGCGATLIWSDVILSAGKTTAS